MFRPLALTCVSDAGNYGDSGNNGNNGMCWIRAIARTLPALFELGQGYPSTTGVVSKLRVREG